jgi:hypothetical protein
MEIIERSLFEQRGLFKDWNEFTKVIRTSITNNFLDTVSIYGKRRKETVFLLDITIDWEQHRLLANNSTFAALDPKRSIAEQVDGAIGQIIAFVQKKTVELRIDEIVPLFIWTSSDNATLAKRRELAGTGPLAKSEQNEIHSFTSRAIGVEVRPEALREMTISVKFTR